jgi:excisionase family DNA binding protein
MEKLLKIIEVAAILAVNKSTVRRLLKSGAIPYFRIKTAIRVKESALALYLESVQVHAV